MFWIGRFSHRLAALWLGLSSLAFYAAWDPAFVLILLTSICFNYGAGYVIGHRISSENPKQAEKILIFAITLNITLLGYFKYTNFFISSTNAFFGGQLTGLDIVLPLGISFFTFTQIAYLVDVYRRISREYNFIHYLLFVTYFPHLIAGPILHHKQMIPQFSLPETYSINLNNVTAGLSIFILGLAKKVLIADHLAEYATPIFKAADAGATMMFIEAWVGSLSYTLQLYFDFSAYCDMAIGLSLMLNIRLPMNFNSPYKATSIIDFWRRWHMTLSAFLRDYLYIPLGGNRKGKARRYINLITTMLLGGLWHGAGWTFVIWGGLHGLYLMVNHSWRELKARLGWSEGGGSTKLGAGVLTFLSVVVAWVFFRAESFSGAWAMLAGMSGVNGVSLPASFATKANLLDISGQVVVFQGMLSNTRLDIKNALIFIPLGLGMVWLLPNVREMFIHYQATWDDVFGKAPFSPPSNKCIRLLAWQPKPVVALLLGALFVICIFSLTKASEFLYFEF